MKNWTLFLDRDGVINERLPGDYVSSWDDFHFCEGLLPAMAFFKAYFGRIIVITNQQGIGKGLMSIETLENIHHHLLSAVHEAGGRIDHIYYSPDLSSTPDHTRKPRPAMGFKAREDFPEIIFEQSLMVGDSQSDIAFGKNLGMKTALILGKADEEAIWIDTAMQPDYRFSGLNELADFLTSNSL
jgi:histidinol-phosphate phosphatase family protein